MDTVHNENERETTFFERRKLTWSAIVAGVVVTLGLQVLLVYFGGALGLAAFNPYAVGALTWPSLLYLTLAVLVTSFSGAWTAGHWANLLEGEDAFVHGVLTWALSTVLVALGLTGLAQLGLVTPLMPEDGMASMGTTARFNALADPGFATLVLNRAREWAQNNNKGAEASEPINVTASKKEGAANASDNEIADFITENTTLTAADAHEFLTADKAPIDKARAESEQSWEQARAREQALREHSRRAFTGMAWVMTALASLSLLAAIGGSYLGWRQEYSSGELIPPDEGTTSTGSL